MSVELKNVEISLNGENGAGTIELVSLEGDNVEMEEGGRTKIKSISFNKIIANKVNYVTTDSLSIADDKNGELIFDDGAEKFTLSFFLHNETAVFVQDPCQG